MITQTEELLLNHLNIPVEKARQGQIEGNYPDLTQYLIVQCVPHDQAIFNDLMERLRKKFTSCSNFPEVWAFLGRLNASVSKLE